MIPGVLGGVLETSVLVVDKGYRNTKRDRRTRLRVRM